MSEKDEASSEEPIEAATAPDDSVEVDEPVISEPVESTPEPEVETLPVREKPKRKREKPSKLRPRLTVLQAAVFETIRERPQRPRAIQTIIRGVGGVDIPRNEIIRCLSQLKKKGLVEKVSAKAWQAK